MWKSFGDRILLPFYSPTFELLGFRGLTWIAGDHRPKALPYPHGVFDMALPLGMNPMTVGELKRTRFAVLVEGEIDMLSCWVCGIPAIASCMASLTETAARALAQVVDAVVIWADHDDKDTAGRDAGIKGAVTSQERLQSLGCVTTMVMCQIPGVKDANDYLTQVGAQAFRAYVTNAVKGAT